MDNPSLFVPAIVGDGEAETGPLATGWQSNKLVNPRTDGIVLPILHLNGYKIANPTILSRISDEELHEFFHGMGYEPYEFVAGSMMRTTCPSTVASPSCGRPSGTRSATSRPPLRPTTCTVRSTRC